MHISGKSGAVDITSDHFIIIFAVIVVGHSNCGGVKTALENATGSNHVIPGQQSFLT